MTNDEHQRLREINDDTSGWRRWGPYVSDRSWATVREDYSPDGRAWDYLPHDLARSKAYRWGEDAIAGLCDRYQLLVFAPAFWNGRDRILKERLFGVTPAEGNHGEDVKEYYFHLDNTPTHSYMRFLYKYPQAEYPYAVLVEENRRRAGQGLEFELLDTGVFDEDRYFDVVIEYAKATPEDLCIRIEITNRGLEPATLHVLPQLWFRNTWAWSGRPEPEPVIHPGPLGPNFLSVTADEAVLDTLADVPVHYRLGRRALFGPNGAALLFTDNETNAPRVFGPGAISRKPYVKDAFHRHVIHGEQCVNPARVGSKAALWYGFPNIAPGGSAVLRLRLSDRIDLPDPLGAVDAVVAQRRREADAFYESLHPPGASPDERHVQRQALAGLLWSKQTYLFDVDRWLHGDNPHWPPPASRLGIRNRRWTHLHAMRVLSVPDKWEYPGLASWDLAFHAVVAALVDPAYARDQLALLLSEEFQHPSGQLPAHEWEFSDLTPPIHAWAVWRVYDRGRRENGKGDRDFLEKCFHRLLGNFAWWLAQVDRWGNNVLEGGLLGLDNLAAADPGTPGKDGAVLELTAATGWMGLFCLDMLRIALELAAEDRVYEGLAVEFFRHFLAVAAAMRHKGNRPHPLWDAEDGFFQDVLRYPDGRLERFRVRALAGLVPLFAVGRLDASRLHPSSEFTACFHWLLKDRKGPAADVVRRIDQPGGETTYVLLLVNDDQLRRLLDRAWNADEFLSDYGLRSVSKAHERAPVALGGRVVGYEPAEAVTKRKGGNVNWGGPIWFPACYLLIESLRQLGEAYGPQFTVTPPATGGRPATLVQLARDLADRLVRIFTRAESGRRPVFGGSRTFQDDPHWRDHLLFCEYFHGDNGAGLGASHQTGWTALVATLLDEWRR